MQLNYGNIKSTFPDQYIIDGIPLDFSYKSLRSLSEIITTEPRSGDRLPIPKEELIEEKKENSPGNSNFPKNGESEEVEEDSPKKLPQQEIFKPAREPIVKKILTEQTTSKTVANSAPGHADENQASTIKKAKVKTKTSSIILSYNTIPDLTGLTGILSKVLPNYLNLKWVDLSYNHLTILYSELCDLPNLMSLYLHSNYLSDMKEIVKLRESPLKFLTLYGNPIDQLPLYRMYVLTILPQVRKLDSVLVTKLEKDNSSVFSQKYSFKNLPFVTNPPVPVIPKDANTEEEEEEEKNN